MSAPHILSDARRAILMKLQRDASAGERPAQSQAEAFALKYRLGLIDLSPWIRAAVPSLTASQLRRWLQEAEAAPSNPAQGRKDKGLLEATPGFRDWALAQITHQPALTAAHLRLIARDRFGDALQGQPMPSVRTFQMMMTRWKQRYAVEITKITNPDAFKSHHRLTGSGTDRAAAGLNDLWMVDASPADVLLLDGRWSIYLCIDVWSRRIIVYVSPTPRASAVAALIRRAILEWGVPTAIKTDNGSDFVAHDIIRLFDALGIERITARAFAPEQKAHVERVIGTYQRDFCTLLPGFIGHSVADRKIIEARRAFAQRLGLDDARAFCVTLNASDFQEKSNAWARDLYQHRPHAGLDGITPFAMASRHTAPVRRIADIRALDMLIAPVAGGNGLRILTKQGLRIDGQYFIAPHIMPGQQVLVRLDEADAGRALVFTPDGATYLGEAICPHLSGLYPAVLVAKAKAAQRALIDASSAEIRMQARKIKPADMVDAVLRQAAKDAGTLIEFPHAFVDHATPQIAAAATAASALIGPGPVTVPPEAEIEAEATGRAARLAPNVMALPETARDRYRRAHELSQALQSALPVPSDDVLWLGRYQMTPEFNAMARMFEASGLGWLYG